MPLRLHIRDSILPAFVHDQTTVSLVKFFPKTFFSEPGTISAQSSLQTIYFTLGARVTFTIHARVFLCDSTNNALNSASPVSPAVLAAMHEQNEVVESSKALEPHSLSMCFSSSETQVFETETDCDFPSQSFYPLHQGQLDKSKSKFENHDFPLPKRPNRLFLHQKSSSRESFSPNSNLPTSGSFSSSDGVSIATEIRASTPKLSIEKHSTSLVHGKSSLSEHGKMLRSKAVDFQDVPDKLIDSHQHLHGPSEPSTNAGQSTFGSTSDSKSCDGDDLQFSSATKTSFYQTGLSETIETLSTNTQNGTSLPNPSSENCIGPLVGSKLETPLDNAEFVLVDPRTGTVLEVKEPTVVQEKPFLNTQLPNYYDGLFEDSKTLEPMQSKPALFNIQCLQGDGEGMGLKGGENLEEGFRMNTCCSAGRIPNQTVLTDDPDIISNNKSFRARPGDVDEHSPILEQHQVPLSDENRPEFGIDAGTGKTLSRAETLSNLEERTQCESDQTFPNPSQVGGQKYYSTYTERTPPESSEDESGTNESSMFTRDTQCIDSGGLSYFSNLHDGKVQNNCTDRSFLNGMTVDGDETDLARKVKFYTDAEAESLSMTESTKNKNCVKLKNPCGDIIKCAPDLEEVFTQREIQGSSKIDGLAKSSSQSGLSNNSSISDEGSNLSDASDNYRPRHRLSSDQSDLSDGNEDAEDDSSSDEDMTAGMVLAQRMREEYARKQQLRSRRSISDDKDERLISECSGTCSYGDDDDHFENLDGRGADWGLLKSKSIKCLRRSKSKRRVVDVLPNLINRRSGRQHSIIHSEGVHKELPVLMDLPTRRRLTIWMVDGPCEDDMDDDDDSSCEEGYEIRRRAPRKPRQSTKRKAAQLQSFVLFSCTKPGPPARAGLISPLQKTVVFPCADEERVNTAAPPDYINLPRPGSVKRLATENSSSVVDGDLKFIEDPDYIEDEDDYLEENDECVTVPGESAASRAKGRLRREKILIPKSNSKRVNLELEGEETIQCRTKESEPVQVLEQVPPIESNEKFLLCPGVNGFDSHSENVHSHYADEIDVVATIEEKTSLHDQNSMNEPSGSGSSPVVENGSEVNENTERIDEDGHGYSSLSKRRRYMSRTSSGSSAEEWRDLEAEPKEGGSGRDNLCYRTSFSEIVNCSIQDVVHKFRPNHPNVQELETSVSVGPEGHLDESDEERLFRKAVCNQGGVTQKRLTDDELKIADLELDLENAERETTRMEDMLIKWVERLEGEKADILFKKQQLEEQLNLQREKDEKDQILRDNFFGGRSLPQSIREQNSEEVAQLRQELDAERKRVDVLKRENERLLRVILCLKQELDSQTERQQRALELERMLKQTKEMLQCEQEERHRLEKLIQDIDRGKPLRNNFASSSSSSPKKNRSGRLWW